MSETLTSCITVWHGCICPLYIVGIVCLKHPLLVSQSDMDVFVHCALLVLYVKHSPLVSQSDMDVFVHYILLVLFVWNTHLLYHSLTWMYLSTIHCWYCMSNTHLLYHSLTWMNLSIVYCWYCMSDILTSCITVWHGCICPLYIVGIVCLKHSSLVSQSDMDEFVHCTFLVLYVWNTHLLYHSLTWMYLSIIYCWYCMSETLTSCITVWHGCIYPLYIVGIVCLKHPPLVSQSDMDVFVHCTLLVLYVWNTHLLYHSLTWMNLSTVHCWYCMSETLTSCITVWHGWICPLYIVGILYLNTHLLYHSLTWMYLSIIYCWYCMSETNNIYLIKPWPCWIN